MTPSKFILMWAALHKRKNISKNVFANIFTSEFSNSNVFKNFTFMLKLNPLLQINKM